MDKYQQGDVLLLRVRSIPRKSVQRKNNHLAEGEVTGHFHDAVGVGVAVLESDGELFLQAPKGASINHQEHGQISVPPGMYRVRRVLEYDHFAEEASEVQD